MTASTETEIAVMKKDQAQMAKDIAELKDSVKRIEEFLMGEDPKVVTKKEYEAYKSEVSNELGALNRRRWVQNTLSAVLGVVLTVLIGYFLTHIGK